mmetsp:Transcript_22361/g.34623  ORF Transcript_22361/g.34623 Transcript_22361/m.34623 type:complete len:89 (+) Transcript_22361:264-530(+)
MEVRKNIELGNISKATCIINEIEPSLIDRNAELNFQLKKQQLIEYIREKRINKAVTFAQNQVTPLCQPPYFISLAEKAQAFEFDQELN